MRLTLIGAMRPGAGEFRYSEISPPNGSDPRLDE